MNPGEQHCLQSGSQPAARLLSGRTSRTHGQIILLHQFLHINLEDAGDHVRESCSQEVKRRFRLPAAPFTHVAPTIGFEVIASSADTWMSLCWSVQLSCPFSHVQVSRLTAIVLTC